MEQTWGGASEGERAKYTGMDEERVTLLPAAAFADRDETSGHHPHIERVFAARCEGMNDPPTAQDLARALTGAGADTLNARERRALGVWLTEASTAEMVEASLDGAYSMRALVGAMHAMQPDTVHAPARIRAINTHCEAAWIPTRDAADPAARAKAPAPRRRF